MPMAISLWLFPRREQRALLRMSRGFQLGMSPDSFFFLFHFHLVGFFLGLSHSTDYLNPGGEDSIK